MFVLELLLCISLCLFVYFNLTRITVWSLKVGLSKQHEMLAFLLMILCSGLEESSQYTTHIEQAGMRVQHHSQQEDNNETIGMSMDVEDKRRVSDPNRSPNLPPPSRVTKQITYDEYFKHNSPEAKRQLETLVPPSNNSSSNNTAKNNANSNSSSNKSGPMSKRLSPLRRRSNLGQEISLDDIPIADGQRRNKSQSFSLTGAPTFDVQHVDDVNMKKAKKSKEAKKRSDKDSDGDSIHSQSEEESSGGMVRSRSKSSINQATKNLLHAPTSLIRRLSSKKNKNEKPKVVTDDDGNLKIMSNSKSTTSLNS